MEKHRYSINKTNTYELPSSTFIRHNFEYYMMGLRYPSGVLNKRCKSVTKLKTLANALVLRKNNTRII